MDLEVYMQHVFMISDVDLDLYKPIMYKINIYYIL